MSEQRKWGVHDCPNGFYYLADSIDGLYVGTGGYILDDDIDGILAICELLNEKESIISALKEENEQLHEENSILNNNEEDLRECTLGNIQLKEENEQLQKQITEYNLILKQHEFAEKEGFK